MMHPNLALQIPCCAATSPWPLEVLGRGDLSCPQVLNTFILIFMTGPKMSKKGSQTLRGGSWESWGQSAAWGPVTIPRSYVSAFSVVTCGEAWVSKHVQGTVRGPEASRARYRSSVYSHGPLAREWGGQSSAVWCMRVYYCSIFSLSWYLINIPCPSVFRNSVCPNSCFVCC